jgi:hypothetical protein
VTGRAGTDAGPAINPEQEIERLLTVAVESDVGRPEAGTAMP